jgi:hypothetical protein
MDNRLQAGRGAENRQPNTTTTTGSVIAAMYACLAMTVVAIILAYVDLAASNTLTDHIRAGYPTYTQTRIDTAATTYLVYLSIIGVLGVVGWLWTTRAIKTGERWARGAATAMFRARHEHRPDRSAHQGYLRGHRPAAIAGLGRHAPLPGGTPGRHPAVEKAAAKGERMSPVAEVVSMTCLQPFTH